MTINHCDHNHVVYGEVRLLPTGGEGNMILCKCHYRAEMLVRFHNIMQGIPEDLPTWESLKVYEGDK